MICLSFCIFLMISRLSCFLIFGSKLSKKCCSLSFFPTRSMSFSSLFSVILTSSLMFMILFLVLDFVFDREELGDDLLVLVHHALNLLLDVAENVSHSFRILLMISSIFQVVLRKDIQALVKLVDLVFLEFLFQVFLLDVRIILELVDSSGPFLYFIPPLKSFVRKVVHVDVVKPCVVLLLFVHVDHLVNLIAFKVICVPVDLKVPRRLQHADVLLGLVFLVQSHHLGGDNFVDS
mmetsp:Transcript_10399/g.11650  ORF Transcript_10399/g.11650 Transcript_10399/m.11650 type:complete len:235 (-) Transcript_10399:1430-2134(-)